MMARFCQIFDVVLPTHWTKSIFEIPAKQIRLLLMDTLYLSLHTRNLEKKLCQAHNPLTGKLVSAYMDAGMTQAETDALARLLSEAGASEPDPDGFQIVTFQDGSFAHIDLEPVAGVAYLYHLKPNAIEFVYQLALASGMLITSTIDPDVVAVLPGQHHSGIEVRWPNAIQIQSVQDLTAWISSEVAKGRMIGE